MAFVRNQDVGSAVPLAVPAAPGEALGDADPARRWRAAQALAGDAAAAPALAARLEREPDGNVRSALFASLAAIGGAGIAALLIPFLQRDEPSLRNGAIEALKQLGEAAEEAVDGLLAHGDADLRLLAVEVTRAWPRRRAAPRLLRIISTDPHVNVCAAAVDVATEHGTPEMLAPLGQLRQRFPAQGFIAFAAAVARAHIQSAYFESAPRQNGAGGAP